MLKSTLQSALHIVRTLRSDFSRGQLLQHAYAMAYVTLLSLVPSLAVTFAVISLFTPFLGENSSVVVQLKDFVLSHLATGSGEQVINYLDQFIQNVDIAKIGFTGFVGTLVTLILLLGQVEAAMNRIFGAKHERSMFLRFIYFWTLITLGTFMIALTIGTFSGFNRTDGGWFSLSAHPVAGQLVYLVGLVIFFTFLYKIVPNAYVGTKEAIYGAIAASILLSAAVRVFRLYTAMFGNYQAIYGAALSAIPVFLLWMYILWLIILACATLTWRLQRGFKSHEEVNSAFSHGRKHQEHRLRAELPTLIMASVYEKYRNGPFFGFNPLELAKQINLPISWIQEALESLCSQGLLQRTLDPVTAEEKFFPAFLPDQIDSNIFQEKLWQDYDKHRNETIKELAIGPNLLAWLKPIEPTALEKNSLKKAEQRASS